MFSRFLATTVLAAGLAFPAMAEDEWKVRDVNVSADLTALSDPASATYWATLETDLAAAIAARTADRADPDGIEIRVELTDIEISDTASTLLANAESRISGEIVMSEPYSQSQASRDTQVPVWRSFELEARIGPENVILPEGTDLQVPIGDNQAYYTALVDAFARAIVERMD